LTAFGLNAQTMSVNEQLKAANLAPTGTLRVALLTNPIHGRIDPDSGEIVGTVRDITAELASRLGVPYQLRRVEGSGRVIPLVESGEVDLGYLAYDETRADRVDFTAPFVTMTSSFLVAEDSPFQSSADVDSSGSVIGVVAGRSQQIFLSANMNNAEVQLWKEDPSEAEQERLLVSGEISAVGQNRQRSYDIYTEYPDTLRVLDDHFMAVPQAVILKKGDTPDANAIKAAALTRFMNELRDSGFIEEAMQRGEIMNGASVAPANSLP
jgi:polar amino acid transport system substrate-binding protein